MMIEFDKIDSNAILPKLQLTWCLHNAGVYINICPNQATFGAALLHTRHLLFTLLFLDDW